MDGSLANLPVIELAMLTDAELQSARTGANVPIVELQKRLDQEYPQAAYSNLNAGTDKKPLWSVKADAVRARADQVFGPYGGGWKDEVEVLTINTENRQGSNKSITWYVIDVRYQFYYLVKWTDGEGTEHRAWVGLPDLFDSDEMMNRGFVFRAGRSVGLKQAFKYLGGFRHITGKFEVSGEEEDDLRHSGDESAQAAQQADGAKPRGARAKPDGKSKSATDNGALVSAAPSFQQPETLVPVDQVKPETLVKDTDLSWLTDEKHRQSTLKKCGPYAWAQLAKQVPSAIPFFLTVQAKLTPEPIKDAIRAGLGTVTTAPDTGAAATANVGIAQ